MDYIIILALVFALMIGCYLILRRPIKKDNEIDFYEAKRRADERYREQRRETVPEGIKAYFEKPTPRKKRQESSRGES